MNSPTSSDVAAHPVILCVDDEPNILSSLKRLLHRQGYQVLLAGSGAEGLTVLEKQAVDLVISDMRMPEMDGAHFLEQVRQRWPETMRVLLTGYADVESTMAAINKGEIYRYIAKPWDDNDVLLLVKHAMERKGLELEKRRLEALTQRQNEELKTLNASLEVKVQERTKALQQALQGLEKSNDQLRKNFLTSVSIFSNLMELRAGGIAGHSRRVAELARKIAVAMDMGQDEIPDVVLASLLHDIGKIGLPDALLERPWPELNQVDQEEVMRHPVIAEAALMPLGQLKKASQIIRAHHERFDGKGYPDALSGFEIPMGARILTVANDYDAAQFGEMLSQKLSASKAYDFILASRGSRYDPAVVDAFKSVCGGVHLSHEQETKFRSPQLRSGMILSRDLISREGLLLLNRDYVLDDKMIEQMVKYEHVEGYPLNFWIRYYEA